MSCPPPFLYFRLSRCFLRFLYSFIFIFLSPPLFAPICSYRSRFPRQSFLTAPLSSFHFSHFSFISHFLQLFIPLSSTTSIFPSLPHSSSFTSRKEGKEGREWEASTHYSIFSPLVKINSAWPWRRKTGRSLVICRPWDGREGGRKGRREGRRRKGMFLCHGECVTKRVEEREGEREGGRRERERGR